MKRRQFMFWFGFGLFSLGERLRLGGLDNLAAAAMRLADPQADETPTAPADDASPPEHWTAAENNAWRWFERETLVKGRWKLTGITTPIDKVTGERFAGRSGYLDDSLVPAHVRSGNQPASAQAATEKEEGLEPGPTRPDAARRARHGRPPSKWLRSLTAEEIRTFLKTIEVPEAGVSGMTFETHLTRDHSFDPAKIAGLTLDEQAKLHAAAHHGY